MTKIHMDGRDLVHIMSVNIGAAYVSVEDAAKRLKVEVTREPIVMQIYPEVPDRAYSISDEDLCVLLEGFSSYKMTKTSNLTEALSQIRNLHGEHKVTYRDGNVLRLSKPFNHSTVI